MEHRWGERLRIRKRVMLGGSDGSRGMGYILDVSISGALLVSGVRAHPLSFMQIYFDRRLAGHAASIGSQVVRQTRNGFAVEWTDLAPEIVRSLRREHAKAHGGEVALASSDEKGTTFSIILPRSGTPLSESMAPQAI